MRLLTTTGTLREQFAIRQLAYRRTFSQLLRAIADFCNNHCWVAFAAISGWCGSIRFGSISSRPLDHDELYTFYIAQAPTLGKLLTLTRTVDLHPPLSYVLVRFSLALFGTSNWSCRLPSALAFVLTAAFLFLLLRTMLSPIYGVIAVLFLWSGPFSYYAQTARPYSLLLCFTSLLLLSWYRATENIGSRRLALGGILVGGFGLLLSHVLGVLPFALFVAAELLRSVLSRKWDWNLWLALLAPMIAVITYFPLIAHHSTMLFTPAYRVTAAKLLRCYWEPLRFVITPLVLVLVLAILELSRSRKFLNTPNKTPRQMNLPLALLLLGLFLVPLAVALVFSRTGASFFDRYGVVMLIPVAVVPAWLLAYGARRDGRYPAVAAVLLALLLYFNASGKMWLLQQLSNIASPKIGAKLLYLTELPPVYDMVASVPVPLYLQREASAAPSISELDSVEPDLPLVAGTGLTFLEIDRTADSHLAQRLFLLTDHEAAATIAHDTVFENYEQLKNVFPVRGTIQPFCSFIANHPRFLILGSYKHPQGWLLRKLERDGVQLKVIGIYDRTFDDHELYEITVPASYCASNNITSSKMQ